MPPSNLLADENVDQQIVDRLRQEGHTVTYVAELDPGIDAEMVIQRTNEANALLITSDSDFGDLLFRRRKVSVGVILVRLSGLSPESKVGIVASALRTYADELPGAISVISPGMVRIRRAL